MAGDGDTPSQSWPPSVTGSPSRLHGLPRSSSSSLNPHLLQQQRCRISRSVSTKSELSVAATTTSTTLEHDLDIAATAAATVKSESPSASSRSSLKGKGRETAHNGSLPPVERDELHAGLKIRDFAGVQADELGGHHEDTFSPSLGGSASISDDEDQDVDQEEDEEEAVAQFSDTDIDPRAMLREQLKRSESVRAAASISSTSLTSAVPLPLPSASRSRTQSHRSGLSIPKSALGFKGKLSGQLSIFTLADRLYRCCSTR